MDPAKNYLQINRQTWNRKTEVHLKSDFYDLKGFLEGKSSLNSIELNLLGDVTGKRLLHLQCHFGQDTISLARLGATCTGVDLSDSAIRAARELAEKTSTNASFIRSDIYDLPLHLDQQFDIVFTSYGTIGWLPDMDRWAGVVARYLKRGGMFVFVEFHPVVWMFDDDFREIRYRYFQSEPIVETETGTYANRDAALTQEYVCWNHGMGEVLSALLSKGLTVDALQEFDYSPYNCFNGTVEFEPGKYRIEHLGDRIPMVYALRARK